MESFALSLPGWKAPKKTSSCHESARVRDPRPHLMSMTMAALYRFKTRRTMSNLRIHGISYAARWYSLITPPSTFRRWTGKSSGALLWSSWSGGRCRRDW